MSWLYVPPLSAPALEDLTSASTPPSDPSAPELTLWSLSNGKPIAGATFVRPAPRRRDLRDALREALDLFDVVWCPEHGHAPSEELDADIAAALSSTDRSTHPTIVEYAVQSLFKGKTPGGAARHAAKKHSGTENIFFGPGVTTIDAKQLEDALWARMADYAAKGATRFKTGKEHFALDGTLQHYQQKPALRAELKRRVIERLGHNPFSQDDR